jgi:cell division protein FtsL
VARRRPRWPLIALALVFAAALLGVAVISPMLVSSAVTDIESAVGRAEAKERALTADNTALASKISALSAPDRVAEQAARLGLEPAEDVSYVAPGRSATATEGGTTLAVR